jgi:hypothetical protein
VVIVYVWIFVVQEDFESFLSGTDLQKASFKAQATHDIAAAVNTVPARLFVSDLVSGQMTRNLSGERTTLKCLVVKLHALPVSKAQDPRCPEELALELNAMAQSPHSRLRRMETTRNAVSVRVHKPLEQPAARMGQGNDAGGGIGGGAERSGRDGAKDVKSRAMPLFSFVPTPTSQQKRVSSAVPKEQSPAHTERSLAGPSSLQSIPSKKQTGGAWGKKETKQASLPPREDGKGSGAEERHAVEQMINSLAALASQSGYPVNSSPPSAQAAGNGHSKRPFALSAMASELHSLSTMMDQINLHSSLPNLPPMPHSRQPLESGMQTSHGEDGAALPLIQPPAEFIRAMHDLSRKTSLTQVETPKPPTLLVNELANITYDPSRAQSWRASASGRMHSPLAGGLSPRNAPVHFQTAISPRRQIYGSRSSTGSQEDVPSIVFSKDHSWRSSWMGDEGISKMTHFGHQDQTSFGHGTAGVGVLLQKTTNHDGEVSMSERVSQSL